MACGTSWRHAAAPTPGASSAGRRWSIVTRRWPSASGRRPTGAGPKGRDPSHYDPPMRHPYLSRAAARLRRSLGLEDLARRLDDIEARLSAIGTDRYPNGPVYLGDHTALVATRWGAKMLVDTRDAMVTPWLVLDGLWESHATGWLQQALGPGQVFVDVGANVGYFTLLAGSLVGPTGTVVAVEAHPRLAELLRRNVIING